MYYFCTARKCFYLNRDINIYDGVVLQPRVPMCRLADEDNTTKRVCVSDSVKGCLKALCSFNNDIFTVYEACFDEDLLYTPSVEQVRDVNETGEKWVLGPVKLKRLYDIRITDDECNYMILQNAK